MPETTRTTGGLRRLSSIASATPLPGHGQPDRELYCREWLPAGGPAEQSGDVVLFLHGVESHSLWFDDLGGCLAAMGLPAFCYDRAGFGQSPGRPGHIRNRGTVLAELCDVHAHLAGRFRRIHLAGLSWGGLLAAWARMNLPRQFATVTLMAPAICVRRSIPWPAKLATLCDLLLGTATSTPLPITVRDFTADPQRQSFIAADRWRNKTVTGRFLYESLRMQATLQLSAGRLGWDNVQVILAGTENLVDNDGIKTFAARAGAAVHVLEDSHHSVIFDATREVADLIVGITRTKGAP